jgi:DNA-binding NtrC family response regulator
MSPPDSTVCRSSLTIEEARRDADPTGLGEARGRDLPREPGATRPSSPSIGDLMSKPLAWQPGRPLIELELEALTRTLKEYGGNRAQAARALGLSLSTIKNKIKRFGIVAENPRGRPRLEKIG